MHIPDGFLDAKTVVATSVISGGTIALALRQMKRSLPPRGIPMMGLMASVVFVAQMVNFPVAVGTSGHLIGALLVSVFLGPAAGILVMTAVLVTQALLFADGGLLSLGANVLNIGIIATLAGYAVYRGLATLLPGERGRIVAVGFAGWCSTVAAAVVCSGELAWSGLAPWGTLVAAMTNVHMVIGVGEGLISALVIAGVTRVRPELVTDSHIGLRGGTLGGALLLLVLFLFVAPFASAWPDGLEQVAAQLGFDHHAIEAEHGAMDGYGFPGIGSPVLATVIAGLIGMVAVFGLSVVVARILIPRTPE
jgi:cobalt/nickel transport system permease protein